MRRGRATLGVALAVLAAAGCTREPDLFPVTGAVKVDGKLAEGVQVSFWPADAAGKQSRTRHGMGMTNKDGRFEVRSAAEGGLEAGDYKVTFTRAAVGGKVVTALNKKSDNSRQTLPEKYADQDKTDVTAQVTKDNHDFVFDLSSKAK
jgi:hypothetical protein